MMEGFTTELRKARIRKGHTISEAARLLNCTPAKLKGYESGDRDPGLLNVKTVIKAGKVYGVSLAGLIVRPPRSIRTIDGLCQWADDFAKLLLAEQQGWQATRASAYVAEHLSNALWHATALVAELRKAASPPDDDEPLQPPTPPRGPSDRPAVTVTEDTGDVLSKMLIGKLRKAVIIIEDTDGNREVVAMSATDFEAVEFCCDAARAFAPEA